ncbi:MAG TPA: hypothetical protein IAD15_06600 [Candidatus Fimiplasma intestinipullorum]|uniref:Transmembrane protein n=1 Tax=Candidatus Fimiplasma intestinipullorum TaxID=2840825 RepID=A0A9D1HQN9_9FIRM|nr:hypothetical protein [Candidatus Fimiplasma intestinipullorum]
MMIRQVVRWIVAAAVILSLLGVTDLWINYQQQNAIRAYSDYLPTSQLLATAYPEDSIQCEIEPCYANGQIISYVATYRTLGTSSVNLDNFMVNSRMELTLNRDMPTNRTILTYVFPSEQVTSIVSNEQMEVKGYVLTTGVSVISGQYYGQHYQISFMAKLYPSHVTFEDKQTQLVIQDQVETFFTLA